MGVSGERGMKEIVQSFKKFEMLGAQARFCSCMNPSKSSAKHT